MGKILGLDLGTNSIGLTIRDTEAGETFSQQLDLFSSIIFPSGVGSGKSGEFSYAAERTKHRSMRRLYQARKYRIWATLDLLIKEGYCPLSIEDLDKWRKYDKEKGLHREYPVGAEEFERWVCLDFDGDGKPDYSSPYALRAEIMEKQFDFSQQTDRYKLGRILYHIAQRRGFKSSKGETLKDLSEKEKKGEIDLVEELKRSEQKKSQALASFMEENNCPTVGCAFYELEKRGIRIKASEYQAVRSQYKDEIKAIFEFQDELDIESPFYKRLMSEKKGEGTIFYKRPLRSQKGKIGNCLLEPNKARCPISHPEFEEYRAWCFINNIKYRKSVTSEWEDLPLEWKNELFEQKFLRIKSSFNFEEITAWLSLKVGVKLSGRKKSKQDEEDERTINYTDDTNVATCPISARLKKLLGDDYKQWKFETEKVRINKKTGETHKIVYDYIDVWHICFSYDEMDCVQEFGTDTLKFDEEQCKQLCRIFMNIEQGYSNLSLKAIKNINRFLKRGFIYTDAVLLAKLPDLFVDKWQEVEDAVVNDLDAVIAQNRSEREVNNIVNALIADYKSLSFEDRFAEHDTNFKLRECDYEDIDNKVKKLIGEKTWSAKSEQEKARIKQAVSERYQGFFATSERKYVEIPKISEALFEYILSKYDYVDRSMLSKIYHPSMIEMYPVPKPTLCEDGRYLKLLGSPVIGALKNPMAMRILHVLRSKINSLLLSGRINENTRVVVETAREVDDANRRWAVREFQKKREEENKEIEKILREYYKEYCKDSDKEISDSDRRKAKLLFDQPESQKDGETEVKAKPKSIKEKDNRWEEFKKATIKKYALWKEQGFCCIYTGRIISLTDLFDDNEFDIEHTIPRSISFDDSLANQTICDAHYNRNIKKNSIPTELANYYKESGGYSAILPRLKPWFERKNEIEERIEFWKNKSSKAQTKDDRDKYIRQQRLWEMEFKYWNDKLSAFTTKEIKAGFRNNQLNDTRIITRCAYHFLRTVFNRVDVQKGNITSEFRKVTGIQGLYEKKDRSKHSHHAIDAAILTLIPSAAKRDKMLEYFYKKEEASEGYYDNLLQREMSEMPKGISDIIKYIEDNILVEHTRRDKALTLAKKRKRIRGRIAPLLDAEGNVVYETNEDGSFKKDKHGNQIPKAKQWICGNSIRGQLHQDSFYGAIKLNGDTVYVIRRELKYKKPNETSGFASWKDLGEVIVDKDLFKMMREQFDHNDFQKACEEGVYMLDKNGNRVNRIRHIRCRTTVKHPLLVKRQTMSSDKDYKNYYYADSGDLYAMCKYEDVVSGRAEYRAYNLFEISENRKSGVEDIPKSLETSNGNILYITQKLITGDMVLLYEKAPYELRDMNKDQLSKCLYVVKGFEKPYTIKLVHSANAQPDKELGKGMSIKDYNNMPAKIRQSVKQLHYLLRGMDFEIVNGEIEFLKPEIP